MASMACMSGAAEPGSRNALTSRSQRHDASSTLATTSGGPMATKFCAIESLTIDTSRPLVGQILFSYKKGNPAIGEDPVLYFDFDAWDDQTGIESFSFCLGYTPNDCMSMEWFTRTKTLEEFLAACPNPDVAGKAPEYAEIMRAQGFGDVPSLLSNDDEELKEMHAELKAAGIPPGHSMDIRKHIKNQRSAPPSAGYHGEAPSLVTATHRASTAIVDAATSDAAAIVANASIIAGRGRALRGPRVLDGAAGLRAALRF